MRQKTISRRLVTLFLSAGIIAGATLTSGGAEASGYLTARYGGDEGAPQMANGYAVYFNPAALGGTHGTTITGDLSLALRWAHYKRGEAGLSPSNRDRLLADQKYIDANTGDANLVNLLTLPFAGVNTDFGTKNLRAGYAIYIPFGGSSNWSRGDDRGVPGVPGSSDGVQRWHNISGQIMALYNTFAVAYAFGDTGLSIGASVSPVVHSVATVRARTADDSDDIEFAAGSLKEGRSLLEASGVNLQATGGVYWQTPTGNVRVGAVYMGQPGFGQTRLSGTLEGITSGGEVRQDIDFLQTYPDIFRLGAAFRLPGDKLEIRTDGSFVRWSVFDKQCVVLRGKDCNINTDGSAAGGASDVVLNIPRDWNNSIGWRAGVGYFLNDRIELSGSAQFTTSAVPKSTIDASTIDSFRIYGTLGARFLATKKLALGANYTHIFLLPVNTAGANRFYDMASPSRSPSADGRYASQIGMLNLNAAYTF